MDEGDLTSSLPAILRGLAQEMEMLTERGLCLERSIAQLSANAQTHGEIIEDLQSLDHLLQHFSELRGFMINVADGVETRDALSIDRALGALKLHALRVRLEEAAGSQTSNNCGVPSGEFELL